MNTVFGIDLGTTYSCIAYVDEFNKPVVVANFENERTTPSVVFFDDGDNIIVGNEAKNMLKTDPEKVVSFIKRNMGDPNFIFVDNGVQYKPEQISGFILQKLIKDASEKIGYQITDVVITCPAYFGINEREATKIAGTEFAGINVRAIINEPTAAALAYGIDKAEAQTVLVYDLGGGTFDITMIEVKPESITVVVTGGDHELGGKNWDDALMSYCADKFKEESGISDDILANSETFGDLQLSVENAKKTLTTRDKTKIAVLYGAERVNIELTRELFDKLTAHLLERTIMLTRQMLDDASKKNIKTFDKILLVGGSTRMKQVQERLEQEFKNIPVESYDPDESVAKGAAIYGQQLAINGEIIKKLSEKLGVKEEDIILEEIPETELKNIEQAVADNQGITLGAVQSAKTKISNVISKSFGVLAYVNDVDQKIVNMITKQTSIPAEVTETFSTHVANQNNVEIAIYENELDDTQVDIVISKELGKGIIDNLPPNLPINSPIKVTFKIDDEGTLDIHAVETTGNNELSLSIKTTSVISGQELEDAKNKSKGLKIS